jgi:integrase
MKKPPVMQITRVANQPSALARAADLARDAHGPKTHKQYAYRWRAFETWCLASRLTSLPAAPETVASYYATMKDAGSSVASIEQAGAAIRFFHAQRGLASPTQHPQVASVLRGIRKTNTRAKVQRDALLPEHLKKLLAAMRPPERLADVRDASLLLVGYALALRPMEFGLIQWKHVRFLSTGVELGVLRQKTADAGEASRTPKFVRRGAREETCPVIALKTWRDLLASSIEDISELGVWPSIDRHDRLGEPLPGEAVNDTVKTRVKAAGLTGNFGGHSLRAGLVTQMKQNGKSNAEIQAVTDHEDEGTLRNYDRRVPEKKAPAVGDIGL